MTADLNQDDRGKTVVYQNNRVGTVADVRSGTAYLELEESNVPDQLHDSLGWDDAPTVDEDQVADVRNGQLHLRDDVMA